MLKWLCLALIAASLLASHAAPAAAVIRADERALTGAENREAREVVIQFTGRFAETRDLTPIVNELYVNDFIERYKKFKEKDFTPPVKSNSAHVYFAPGLDYDSRLLAEAGQEDWRRFYIAANNFLLVGLVSALKQTPDNAADIEVNDVYPRGVVKLLDGNPNLANMIVRKRPPGAVGSLEEMRGVITTLEQAAALMRQRQPGKPVRAGDKDWDGAVEMIRADEFFKPQVVVMDEAFFGFPKGTRILHVKTPLGLRLMMARDGDRLRIFWTEIIAD